jgi:hypothetical protein
MTSCSTATSVGLRPHTSAYVRIRPHTSAYVSMRQHTSAYVIIPVADALLLVLLQHQRSPWSKKIRFFRRPAEWNATRNGSTTRMEYSANKSCPNNLTRALSSTGICSKINIRAAYVSRRQQTSADVSRRQHTSAANCNIRAGLFWKFGASILCLCSLIL